MSKARNISDKGHIVGRKNLIINGGMNVKQRADSHSTEGYGSLDRYTMGLSGGSATMSQEDLTLGQSDIPTRFRHYMKLNCTTGNNNCGFYHYIENPSELEGAYVLSFYAKGTNPAAGNFALSVQSSYGTGGSTGVNPHDGTLTVTSSWQRFTVAITFPSLTGKTVNDANGTTGINVRQGGSDTGTAAWALDITGMQLELGSVATDFEHRSYGEELALCQRYYWKDTHNGMVLTATAANRVIGCIYFPVTMRTTPTIVAEVPTRITQFSVVDKVLAGGSAENIQITPNRTDVMFSSFSSGSLDVDNSYISNTAGGKYITASAEL